MAFRCAYCRQTHTGKCATYRAVAEGENRRDAARAQAAGCLGALLLMPALLARFLFRLACPATTTAPTAGGQNP